jgi:glycerol-3-phosphate dehydrogenase (NAD+)
MATVAARNNHIVKMWGRSDKQAASINNERVNCDYLSQYLLHENISATTNLAEAVDGAEVIVLALPAQVTPDFLREHKDVIPPTALLCSTAKGLYLKTKQLLSAAIQDALGREQPFCLLSGPSFAKEIMDNHPTAVVVASKYLYHAVRVQRLLSNLTFRVYSSQDTVGVELGGALKNPLAIGAGMIEGMGLGYNTMAAYVTRSCNELTKLCIAMGGRPETISGLSGVGDLMLTAFGSLSRNRSLGARLARGEKVEDICKEYTVEGVTTAQVAVYYADQCNLELPLFRAVAAILSGDLAPAEAGKLIMSRPLKQEHS